MMIRLALLICCGSAGAATTVFGPLPYRQRSDSPFYRGIKEGTIHLEDFEDGQVTPPGVAMSTGAILRDQGVDEDDGIVDGLGLNRVWSARGQYLPDFGVPWLHEIKFTPDPIKGYPTYVGFALLGFNIFPGEMPVRLYRGYDGTGADFTGDVRINVIYLPSGTTDASTGGDQFAGMYSDHGISRVIIGGAAGRFDHLQFGWAIPEPGTVTLAGFVAALLLSRRRAEVDSPQGSGPGSGRLGAG